MHEGKVEGRDVVAADADKQQENAVSHEGEVQGEPKAQEFELLGVLREQDGALVDVVEAAEAVIETGVTADANFRGESMLNSLVPVRIQISMGSCTRCFFFHKPV